MIPEVAGPYGLAIFYPCPNERNRMKLTPIEQRLVVDVFVEYKKNDPDATFIDCVGKFRSDYGYFGTKYLKWGLMGYDTAKSLLEGAPS